MYEQPSIDSCVRGVACYALHRLDHGETLNAGTQMDYARWRLEGNLWTPRVDQIERALANVPRPEGVWREVCRRAHQLLREQGEI